MARIYLGRGKHKDEYMANVASFLSITDERLSQHTCIAHCKSDICERHPKADGVFKGAARAEIISL